MTLDIDFQPVDPRYMILSNDIVESLSPHDNGGGQGLRDPRRLQRRGARVLGRGKEHGPGPRFGTRRLGNAYDIGKAIQPNVSIENLKTPRIGFHCDDL